MATTMQQRFLSAIGDARGVQAADRLCEACVGLLDVDLASSAQLGPPSSVEPTVRPVLAGQVAMKRERDAAAGLLNNPETGCKSRDH